MSSSNHGVSLYLTSSCIFTLSQFIDDVAFEFVFRFPLRRSLVGNALQSEGNSGRRCVLFAMTAPVGAVEWPVSVASSVQPASNPAAGCKGQTTQPQHRGAPAGVADGDTATTTTTATAPVKMVCTALRSTSRPLKQLHSTRSSTVKTLAQHWLTLSCAVAVLLALFGVVAEVGARSRTRTRAATRAPAGMCCTRSAG